MLLRIVYLDNNIKKFTYLFSGEWMNKFKIKNIKFDNNKMYDVFFFELFDLEKINFLYIEYPYIPPKFDLNVFLHQNISIIDYEKDYEQSIKNVIKNLINDYEEHKRFFYTDIKNFKNLNKNELQDFLILRFYPKYKNNIENINEEFELDINEKYFTMPFQSEQKDYNIPSDIYAFRNMFGISKNNEKTTDPIFLNALKRRWFHVMEEHKKEMFRQLQNTDISFLSQKEKETFHEELKDYEKSIDMKIENLNKFKTPIEVISYWDPHLQPKPCFVYNE
jgi:hypothetical protein